MDIPIKDAVYICSLIVTAVVAFFGSFAQAKDRIRKLDTDLRKEITSLNKEINQLTVQLERQKGKDDLQQHIIDQIKKQNDELIPMLARELGLKKSKDE